MYLYFNEWFYQNEKKVLIGIPVRLQKVGEPGQ